MRLLGIEVRHFRCIESERLELGDLTMLVGANGAGKSAFLRALSYFYEGPGGIGRADFYNRDVSMPIEVAVDYGALAEEEREVFDGYVHDGVLSVVLRVSWFTPEEGGEGTAQGTYHGWLRRHEPFQQVRQAGSAPEKLAALRQLVDQKPELYAFSPESAWTRAEPQMAEWEAAHPDECPLELDEARYLRPPNSGTGPLAPYTQLIFVPAVRDASEEAVESRGSTIGRLVALVVGDLSGAEEVQRLGQEFKKRYGELVRREESERLRTLEGQLAEVLGGYVSNAGVRVKWEGGDVSLIAPRTVVWLEDDGFEGEVEGKGHGLQRLFIVSILQVAAAVRAAASEAAAAEEGAGEPEEVAQPEGQSQPRLRYVLAIEEPELYQHPMQARRFATVLGALASGDGGSAKSQVVYSTHSPLFVGVDRFDGVRVARKVEAGPGLPLVTRIHSASLEEVMVGLNQAFGAARYSLDRFRATLRSILSPSVSEGFFARTAVLVEGPEDQAVVEAALRAGNVDLEGDGIAVVPVEGKANLDRPYGMFSALGISCYVVFDGDFHKSEKDRKPEINVAIQRLCGEQEPAEFPESGARELYAAFRHELSKDLPDEYGAKGFYSVRDEVAREMGWEDEPSRAKKNPVVLREVIRRMHEAGRRSPTLDGVVEAIRKLGAGVPGGTLRDEGQD